VIFQAEPTFPLSCWRTTLVWAFVATCVPVYALNPDYKLSQYIHTSWRSDAGLQAVRRLKQTPDGYLWLATRSGLARFDGVRFSTFRASSGQDLESSTMQDLVIDPDGSLWIATLGGGIAHYQAGKFHSYTSRDGLPSDDIGSLYRDSQGTLWVGTRGGGIARMVQDRFEKLSLGIPTSPITAFLEGPNRSLWIATYGNGVFRLQNGVLTSFSVKDGLPDARISGLYRDHSGKIWTAGWKGISSWNGARFVGNPSINAIVSYAIACTEDRDGSLWIASSSGLFRAHAGEIAKMDRSSGLSGDFVSDVFEDREGNLWVATRAGLDRLRDGPVRTFSNREGLIRGHRPIVADDRGGVWSVSGKQIARVAANNISVRPIALPADSTCFTMLSLPGSGFLIGSDSGVKLWRDKHAALASEIPGLDVRSLLQGRDGTIWIGTANRGLLRWESSLDSRMVSETGVSDRFIATLAEDHTGAIWAGSTNGGGLYRIAGGNVQHFGRAEGLRSLNIYTIFVDGKGALWIGSSGGLSWFQDGRLRTVNSQQGLPADQVFAILEDSYHRLWFTGYGGIAAIEKKSLAEWAAGRRHWLKPMLFRSADGLQINNHERVFPDAARSADGHLWFSMSDGLSEVTPPNPGASHDPKFPVVIEDVTIDRLSHSELGRIRIPPGARSIELRYTALTLSSPETVRFRYQLEGVDNDWVDADARRVAFYNNLKPGTYTFRVFASASEEQWQESSALVLEQLPFFYQTKWFMLLASATALSLAFFVYRLRWQQALDRIQAGFQERMEERTRIAQELHDTVVQAISGSTMLVENAAEKIPDTLPVVKGALLRAVDRLDIALEESRAALKGLRASVSPENDLARQLSEVACDSTRQDIVFNLVITGEARQIRPVVHYEVFRIGSEAITNALKHSDATSVRVDLGYLDELRISVWDNGKGIPEDVLQRGKQGHFGLEGMRERADHIGATIEVYSRVRAGTEVRIIVPGHIAFESSATTSSLVARVVSRIRSLRHRTPA
jgi:ligand-binding sensor domain-containing protein/signal transduction histidine kinase